MNCSWDKSLRPNEKLTNHKQENNVFEEIARLVDFVLLGFAINHGVYNRIFHLIHGLTVKSIVYFNILELLIE